MASVDVEDSTYSSTSEAEADSDHEDLEDDPDKLLGAWLGQLEHLALGLENASSGLSSISCSSGEKSHIVTPRMDSYRFSMANLEDSHEMELDAILGELYAIENHFERELQNKRGHQRNTSSISSASQGLITPSSSIHSFSTHDRPSPGMVNGRSKMDSGNELDGEDNMRGPKSEGNARTDSPDADSAFSDTVSMLSSESSASSGGGGVARTEISSHSVSSKSSGNSLTSSPTQINLFIKAYSVDGSTKSLLVDEKMSVGYIAKLLADKNHVTLDHKWAIVENIPELYMERVFEDHENLVENLLLWTRDSKNKLLFVEREEKFDIFLHPERYLLMGNSSEKGLELDDESRNTLVEEFFAGSGTRVPEVEGMLYLKSDGKKQWKKHYFVLRASGLYYCPKGKSKSSKDLVCLSSLDLNRAYTGIGWRKKYKAPTEFGFALKHPQIQTKTSKYIKYLCADDERCFQQWLTGIRVVKYGRQLLDNYNTLQQDMAEEDLDLLAHARSFSISSMARSSGSSQCTTPSGPTTPTLDSPDSTLVCSDQHSSCSTTPASTLERTWSKRPIRRQDSIRSGSSGTVSERSGNGSPIGEACGFDAEFPTGTIKRKPSMTPKIPLTNTTRSLAQAISDENGHGVGEGSATMTGTLRRTLRRSLTDDRITLSEAVQTLRRQGVGETRRGEVMAVKEKCSSPKSEECPVVVEAETVDNLPLPPPPEFAASMESLVSVDSLPPPPPEAYRNSNLSLDSPLTPPAERRSNSSLNSLPPPPSPLLDNARTAPANRLHSHHFHHLEGGDRARMFGSLRLPSKMSSAPPPPPPKPQQQRRSSEAEAAVPLTPLPFLAELKAQAHSKGFATAPHPRRASSVDRKPPASQSPASPPAVPAKKITFRDESPLVAVVATGRQVAPPPLPPPMPPNLLTTGVVDLLRPKPPPPRRSESTRLSGRSATMSRVGNSQVTPPKTFLADLQRVMEKKWKVAQQLKMDLGSTAHAVMGFRDPPMPDDVLCCATHLDEREKMAAAKANTLPHHSSRSSPPPPAMPNGAVNSVASCRDSVRSSGFDDARSKKKLPPPPPPKRSETTHLTSSSKV